MRQIMPPLLMFFFLFHSPMLLGMSIGEAFVRDLKEEDDYALIKEYYLEYIEKEVGLKSLNINTTDISSYSKELQNSYVEQLNKIRTVLINKDLEVDKVRLISNVEELKSPTSKADIYLTKNTFTLAVDDTFLLLELTLQHIPKTLSIFQINEVIATFNSGETIYRELNAGLQELVKFMNKNDASLDQLKTTERAELREENVLGNADTYFNCHIQLIPSVEQTLIFTSTLAFGSKNEKIIITAFKDVHPRLALLKLFEIQSLLSNGIQYKFDPSDYPMLAGTKGFDRPFPVTYSLDVFKEMTKDELLKKIEKRLVLTPYPKAGKKLYVDVVICEGSTPGKVDVQLQINFN